MAIRSDIQDPACAAALEEIEAVLKKHQVGGTIILVSRESAAFRVRYPEWCGIQPQDPDENGGMPVRIKLSSDDKETSDSSLHCVLSMRDLLVAIANNQFAFAEFVVETLKKEGVLIDHNPFGGDKK